MIESASSSLSDGHLLVPEVILTLLLEQQWRKRTIQDEYEQLPLQTQFREQLVGQ